MKRSYTTFYTILLVTLLFSSIVVNATTCLFSHGFADSEKQAFKYTRVYKTWLGGDGENNYYIIDGPLKLFNYPDVLTEWIPKIPNIFQTSLGQENELKALRKANNQIEDEDVVLVGVSRGAAAGAIFLGEDNPQNVKAAVLISPYDKADVVFSHHWFATLLSVIPFVTNDSLYKLFLQISQFKENGRHPIDWVDKIDTDKAILFVCSKQDATVAYRSTVNLYKKMLEAGHENTYLLVLNSGKHAKLLKSEEADTFQNVVHAFYEHNGLPCNRAFARKGAQRFAQCQPDLEQVEQLLEVTSEVESSCFEACKHWFARNGAIMYAFGAKVLNCPFEVD